MKRYLFLLGVLLASACGGSKPSTLKDDPAVSLPASLPSNSEAYKIQKEKFEGCYEIVGQTNSDWLDKSWVPGALATRVCAGASSENEFAGFGWHYLGDGAVEDGVAGGFIGRDSDCDDCMSVYHAWYSHTFKWRKIGSFYSLEIHANKLQNGQLEQTLVTTIQLDKVSTTFIPDQTPTDSDLALVKKMYSGCYELNKTHLYGDNIPQVHQDFYSKVTRVCFETADFKKTGSYVIASLENSVGDKQTINLNDVSIRTHADSLNSITLTDNSSSDESRARFSISLDGSNDLNSTIYIQKNPDYIFFDASGSR